MSVQAQDITRPVHRVPARIAFALAGVFVAVGWTVVDDSFDSLPLMSASAVKTVSAAVETKLS